MVYLLPLNVDNREEKLSYKMFVKVYSSFKSSFLQRLDILTSLSLTIRSLMSFKTKTEWVVQTFCAKNITFSNNAYPVAYDFRKRSRRQRNVKNCIFEDIGTPLCIAESSS